MYFNVTLTCIFILELMIRIIAIGKDFFFKFLNIFDFIIISSSFFSFVYDFSSNENSNSSFLTVMNVIEVLRILRVIKQIPYLKKLITVLKVVLPQVANIAVLLFTVILIYSVLGVDLFVYMKPQSNVGGSNVNFRSIFISMMNLFRCMTGESWYLQYADCARTQQSNFVCYDVSTYEDYIKYGDKFFFFKYNKNIFKIGLNGCGRPVHAFLYFFSFIVVVTLLILNLFVATILTATEEITKIEELSINRYQLNGIKHLWKEFDPKGSGYLDYKNFWRFSSKIAIIFGVKREDLLDISNRKNFLKVLELPVYENQETKIFSYKFHDVVIALAKVSVMLKYDVNKYLF